MEGPSVRPMRTILGVGILVLTGLTACSGPDLRRDFRAEKPILKRQWAISTRTRELLAGERGVEYSNPVFWENTLLFGSSEAGLVALYPSLGGTIRWVLPISGGVTSEVLIDGAELYFGGGDGFVYKADAETGRVLWRHDVRNPRISKPTVHSGRVFVTTTDDSIFALDARTGNEKWAYKRKSGSSASIHAASQPWTDGKVLLVGASDGYLLSLSAEEGRLLAEKRLTLKSKFTDVDAGVVEDGSVLYIPSYDGDLHALKKGSLESLWSYPAGGTRAVVISGDRLILGSSDGRVHLLAKDSGRSLWTFDLDGGTPTRPILAGNVILVGSSHQYLYALDARSGQLLDRWNAGYGSGFSGGLAYEPKTRMLYAVSGAANLYTFQVGEIR